MTEKIDSVDKAIDYLLRYRQEVDQKKAKRSAADAIALQHDLISLMASILVMLSGGGSNFAVIVNKLILNGEDISDDQLDLPGIEDN